MIRDNLSALDERIQRYHEIGEYRPVAVNILATPGSERKFLTIRSPKGEHEWLYQQEGIKREGSLETAITRGLKKEVGIDYTRDVKMAAFGHTVVELDAPDTRENRRVWKGGFQWRRGKVYFINSGFYLGNPHNLTLSEDEVAEAHWLLQKESLKHIDRGRGVKALVLRLGLASGDEFLSSRKEQILRDL